MSAVNEYLRLPFKVKTKIYMGAEPIRNLINAELVELVIHARVSMLVVMFFTLEDSKL